MNSFDNPFDTLSYDEKLISERVGMSYSDPVYRPEPALSVNSRVRLKMKETAMIRDEIRREISRERALQARALPTRETFIGSLSQARSDTAAKDHGYPHGSEPIEGMSCKKCTTGGSDIDIDKPLLFDNKVLTILLFVVSAFYVVLWMDMQTMRGNMMTAMCAMAPPAASMTPPAVSMTPPAASTAASS